MRKHGRLITLLVLASLPVCVWALGGAWLIFREGWGLPLGAVVVVCWVLLFAVRRLWPERGWREPAPADHWTPQDEAASVIVREFRRELMFEPAEVLGEDASLTDPAAYARAGVELTRRLSQHYHPGSGHPGSGADEADPIRVGDALAAVRLALDNVEDWFVRTIPGRDLLTVRSVRRLSTAVSKAKTHGPWLERAAWLAASAVQPVQAVRWALYETAGKRGQGGVGEDVAALLRGEFADQLGASLIEMFSGRLRGGARVYRETFDPRTATAVRSGGEPPPVTIALVGQVSAGKSSVINALVGDEVAAIDALPLTAEVSQFRADVGGTPVVLLDTPGYGDDGATPEQAKAIESALRECDAVLLVLAANSPAREADRRTITALREHFASKEKGLRPPVLLGVLTKVDLLPPPREWEPPYDLDRPATPKAESIFGAVNYAWELFGEDDVLPLADVVPVCVDRRSWNVEEGLLPRLVSVLDPAAAVALLRGYERSLSADRWKKTVRQIMRFSADVGTHVVTSRIGSKAGARLTLQTAEFAAAYLRGRSGAEPRKGEPRDSGASG